MNFIEFTSVKSLQLRRSAYFCCSFILSGAESADLAPAIICFGLSLYFNVRRVIGKF